MIRNGRLSKNPLAHLEKIIVTDKDRRRVRMASEDGELERLLAATMAGEEHHGLSGPERALLYRLAIETGFRWSECRSLVKASFNLDGNPPAVTVASGRAKNRKERTNPISRELAADLRAHMALFLPTAGAFPGLRTARRMGAEMLRADLEAAGLPYRDECGQVRDFHSLRKTFGTRLSRAGVPLPVAQRLLDHSTPELTANFYTGVMPADKAEAVARLPAITGSAGDEWSGKATSILEGLEKTGTQGGERLIAGGDTRVNECIGFFELSPPLVGGRLGGTANAMPAAVFGLGEAGNTIEGVQAGDKPVDRREHLPTAPAVACRNLNGVAGTGENGGKGVPDANQGVDTKIDTTRPGLDGFYWTYKNGTDAVNMELTSDLKSTNSLYINDILAERQGFEPWEELPPHWFSKPARSTAPASLRI